MGSVSFGGEFGASHCNQWELCCVVVQERRALPKLRWGGLVIVVVVAVTSMGARYCDVCLSVCSHISKTTRPNFTKFSTSFASVLL